MYEDTPHELVHDLMSEAVFGDHPLGRPVIGTADVISSVGRRALTSYHQTMYRAGNVVVAAAGNLKHDDARRAAREAQRKQAKSPARGPRAAQPRSFGRRGRACASSARRPSSTTSASARRASRAPTGAASPRRSSTPLLGGSASSRLFQEIREKRGHGLLRLHVRIAVHRHRADRLLRRHARREPRRLPRDRERADRRGRGREVPQGRARAGEGEPQGADPALDGVDVEPDEPPREVADLGHGAPVDRPDRRRDRRGHAGRGRRARGVLLAPEKLSASGIGPSEERFRDAVRRIKPELPARAAA